jgi:hypothetical protein
MNPSQLEEHFPDRLDEIKELFERLVLMIDGIPHGNALIALMNLTMVLFQEIGIGKEDAIRFFIDACNENWSE